MMKTVGAGSDSGPNPPTVTDLVSFAPKLDLFGLLPVRFRIASFSIGENATPLPSNLLLTGIRSAGKVHKKVIKFAVESGGMWQGRLI